jgi:hypothetical protein
MRSHTAVASSRELYIADSLLQLINTASMGAQLAPKEYLSDHIDINPSCHEARRHVPISQTG